MLFHEVLPALLDELASRDLFARRWERLLIIVVRDPAGRVRLVFDERGYADDPLGEEALAALSASLVKRLGSWFMGPLLATHSAATLLERRLAAELIKQPVEPWPSSWPLPSGVDGEARTLRALQRFHGNQSWLIAPSAQPGGQPPWAIEDGPKIIAFYSFKGGVGRTTSLAIMAARYAREGKKVACIDLDLEAPGLADFMGIEGVEHGVVDALLTRAVSERFPAGVDAWWRDADVGDGYTLHVMPAGRLDAEYLDKLSRLDLSVQSGPSIVQRALHELLLRSRGKLRLGKDDVILIDCRAGLHELAGIALKHLSHVQVLVARNSSQNIAGLSLALGALSPRIIEEQRCMIIQTFILYEQREAEGAQFRGHIHAALSAVFDTLPDLDDEQALHNARPILYDPNIASARDIRSLPDLVWDSEGFRAIHEKLEELLQ